MALYLVNLDTVNVQSTMDTINSSGSYVGGSKTVSITSGENAIGTFGHVDGNYTNTSSSSSTASSTGGSGGNTSAGNAAQQAALDKAKTDGTTTQPSHTGSSPSTAPSTTSTTTSTTSDFCAWGGACLQLIMLV